MSSYPNEPIPNNDSPSFGAEHAYIPQPVFSAPQAPYSSGSEPLLQTPRGVAPLAPLVDRLFAHIIDLLVMAGISLASIIVVIAASGSWFDGPQADRFTRNFEGITSHVSGIFILFAALAIIGPFVYRVWMTAHGGQTLGKKLTGIRVITAAGTTPTLGVAFVREVLGYAINSMIYGLGWFWLIWDPRRQTWGDKIANTFVVKA